MVKIDKIATSHKTNTPAAFKDLIFKPNQTDKLLFGMFCISLVLFLLVSFLGTISGVKLMIFYLSKF
jgi:hypothetical protein